MIVAPVTESMNGRDSIAQKVWLPEGDWFDFRNNNVFKGGKEITANYSLDEIPVFVKAGSIIPSQTAKLRVTGSVLDTLILTVYPAPAALFSLYEDEGSTEDYRKDVCAFTRLSWQQNKSKAVFSIEPDGNTFPGKQELRSYQIRIVASDKPVSIKQNGKTLQSGTEWHFDDKSRIIYINTSKGKISSMIFEIV